MKRIAFTKGLKYQLQESYWIETPITGYSVETPYYYLSTNGKLVINSGYAWDGASGPTWDSKCSMRPSLVHDVFCEMMREQLLPHGLFRAVNKLFYDLCIEDGMNALRALLWLKAVNLARAGNPKQGIARPVYYAP